MGPKSERKKSISENKPVTLNDPINTEEWRCMVTIVADRPSNEVPLTKMFTEGSLSDFRKEVKCIDFEWDVMKILKEFVLGEVSYRYSYLLNFSAVFEEASEYVKNQTKVPAPLMAKIVKGIIQMLKKDDIDRCAKLKECNNNPIEIMASKSMKAIAENGQSAKEKNVGKKEVAGNEKKKGGGQTKASDLKSQTGVTLKVKPPTVSKEDTRLLKRGEIVKNFEVIKDVPESGCFNLYIALTGFQDANLILELVSAEVPVLSVVCLDSSSSSARKSLTTQEYLPSEKTKLNEFWNDFLKILWDPRNTNYFSNIILRLYTPESLPFEEKELKDFLYENISFLMYEVSEIQLQHKYYLRNMKVLAMIDEVTVTLDPALTNELEELPFECMTVPVYMQYILDNICGEDLEREKRSEEITSNKNSFNINDPQSFGNLYSAFESRVSFSSLIPFTSTVRLPTPRLSSIDGKDYKILLYHKMKYLDLLYGIDEYLEPVDTNTETEEDKCIIKKSRIPCSYLTRVLSIKAGGLLNKYWANYPEPVKGSAREHRQMTDLMDFPRITVDYCVYLVWFGRMVRPQIEEAKMKAVLAEKSSEELLENAEETHFTVTDCSRTMLNKSSKCPGLRSFFFPSSLKIIATDMMKSLSAPELTTNPSMSWKYKSFVSDFHIPVKYLLGSSMNVYDDLRKFLGEEMFSNLKGYDFIEELDKSNMLQRIQQLVECYDCVNHAYCALTDSIYLILYNHPIKNGINRDAYNVSVRTPVGLRDFYEYIMEDEANWLSEYAPTHNFGRFPSIVEECFNPLYDPTNDFRDFADSEFWTENSIKYIMHSESVANSIAPKTDSIQPKSAKEKVKTREKSSEDMSSSRKATDFAPERTEYAFIGYDLGQSNIVQISGIDSVFRTPDNCIVKVVLQERLYGDQELGVHIGLGGHYLHLYSYVCPSPHVIEPFNCHLVFKNGVIVAFEKRTRLVSLRNEGEDQTASDEEYLMPIYDEEFQYDMKLSLPNTLTVKVVRQSAHPCYIKQEYLQRTNHQFQASESSRVYLPNGNVVKFMADDTVVILLPDSTVVTASLGDFESAMKSFEGGLAPEDEVEFGKWKFRNFTETMENGCEYSVENGKVVSSKRYHLLKSTDQQSQANYTRRMDGTSQVQMANGTTCVRFTDNTKICTELFEEIIYLTVEEELYIEDNSAEEYVMVHFRRIIEHPEYATAIYDSHRSSWRILLPCDSALEVDEQGNYHIEIDSETEFDLQNQEILMRKYNSQNELLMWTNTDLRAFEPNHYPDIHYCLITDSTGRKFVVETDGNNYVAHEEFEETGSSEAAIETCDIAQLRRYFVVRRDLSGFEIKHKKHLMREIEQIGPEIVLHCQELPTDPMTRYFVFMKPEPIKEITWAVQSITPETRYIPSDQIQKTSSTYGVPPSWIHPLPKEKPSIRVPDHLTGRIVMEIQPTDCPSPPVSGKQFAFCDLSKMGQTKISLCENVSMIVRRVADQDQEMLKEIYLTAIRQRKEANLLYQPNIEETIKHYLAMSEYHVNLRETLKKAIRYKIIPNYFESPAGLAWSLLNEMLSQFIEGDLFQSSKERSEAERSDSSRDTSEIEYNMEWSDEKSLSDLSYRSNLSMATEPNKPRIVVCKGLQRNAISMPACHISTVSKTSCGSNSNYNWNSEYSCRFTSEDLLQLQGAQPDVDDFEPTFGLEDLMELGLL